MSGPAACGLFGGTIGLFGWLAFGLVFALLGALAYAGISRFTGARRSRGRPADGRPPSAREEAGQA